LNALKIGSRVREDVLGAIAHTIHPIRFVRKMRDGSSSELVKADIGIDPPALHASMPTLRNGTSGGAELPDLLLIDRPNGLTVKFKKADSGAFAAVEALVHRQKCAAILVILLAVGTTPVLLDQPEDALRALWIEECLVDRLRSLRASR
jgi:hypothetical protein